MNLGKIYPKVYLRGKHHHNHLDYPFYSLKDMSAASGLPIFVGQEDAEIVFNWGVGGYGVVPSTTRFFLNKDCIISKFLASQLMRKVNCNTPRSWNRRSDIATYPVVVKPNLSWGGHGIHLLKDKYDQIKTKGSVWFQEYIDKATEYRVYFFQNRVVKISKKIPKDYNYLTWNRKYCINWVHINNLHLKGIFQDLIHDATKVLRIDWGAADIVECKKGKFWIIEINSRPSVIYPGAELAIFEKDKKGVYYWVDGAPISSLSRVWAKEFRRFLEINY